jgi:DNA-binding response OmpR family regulator
MYERLKCLIAVANPELRDIVAAAARSFEHVAVDALALEDGREALRRRQYHVAFVTLMSSSKDSRSLLEEIRNQSHDVLLVGITPRAAIGGKRQERGEYDLFALLGTPLDVVELYATLRRAVDRIMKSRVDARV